MSTEGFPTFSAMPSSSEEESNFLEKNMASLQKIFDINPELAEIGSLDQYAAYVEKIFPNSLVKNIVWHGSKKHFNEFKRKIFNFFGLKLSHGLYFGEKYEHSEVFAGEKGKLFPAKISIERPNKPIMKVTGIPFNTNKGNGYIGKDFIDRNVGLVDEYVVFDPYQIHILGDSKDARAFKEWTLGNKEKSSLFESPQ